MDDKLYEERPKNPRDGANPLSILTFWYTLPLFKLGYKRDLNENDLYEPLKEHTSHQLGESLARLWEEECQRVKRKNDLSRRKDVEHHCKPSLLRVLFRCFGLQLIWRGIFLAIMEIFFKLTQPMILAKLLKYFVEDSKVTEQEAYIYAGLLIFSSVMGVFMIHSYMIESLHLAMKMRVACCSLIYRKSLKLSHNALGGMTIGQSVNLLSNDVSRFDLAMGLLHYVWLGPFQTIIILYLMYQYVQESAIIGIVTLLMFVPLQGFLAKKSSSLRKKTALKTDERVRLTNEMINGIQAIKMYTWEEHFVKIISLARLNEIKFLRGMSYVRGAVTSFFSYSTRLALYITLLSYVLLGNRINAEIVFVIAAYYNILRSNMTAFFPLGMTNVAELMVSIHRLRKFMLYEELWTRTDSPKDSCADENIKITNKKLSTTFSKLENDFNVITESSKSGQIRLKNATAKWLHEEKDGTLRNIDLNVKPGELIAIIGQVGAGKSSLLNVILKELPLTSGSNKVNGQIAYASQEPWLFSSSICQNILFGRKMDYHRYDQVLNVCQLKRDLMLLPHGDKTIIGDRGIRLSGGQRARINLARAVYSDVPIYVFDDPLSAVDAKVGKHIFEECISKFLKYKTRVLVTHQLQYLSFVDRIIVLENGSILAQGSFDELVYKGVDFIKSLENNDEKTKCEDNDSKFQNREILSKDSTVVNSTSTKDKIKLSDRDSKEEGETRSNGTVKAQVYRAYLKNAGSCGTILSVALLFVLSQIFISTGDYFVYEWSKVEENSKIYENGTYENTVGWKNSLTRYDWIYIYTALTALTVITTLVRSAAFFNVCMRASLRLHDNMLTSVSRALMNFFNVNSSGRILNRFSKDLGQVDELLPYATIDVLQFGLSLVGVIVVVAILNPWLMIPTLTIVPIFWKLRNTYMKTSRSVKRLEGITRSPVFAHLSASLQGISTIRAFNADETLINEFDQHQDLHSSAWFNFISSARAFAFYNDFFCVIYIAIVTVSFLISWSQDNGEGKPNKASVGLAITQSITLTYIFQWTMRQSSEMENYMTSVERILEYSKLPSEPPLESSPEKKPKDNWPHEGRIEFKNVSLRYSKLDPSVLKNLNFTIQPKGKIGIVGRTGAGKSSIIQSIFRLADIKGVIKIDGIDTKDIGLHDLRRHISIIPQEPFLFSGDLRRNLDPFNQSEDVVLWQALEEVELKEMGLDDSVSEGGNNMSVGQRQLVCLARAIVKNNPILVLDEATANVDPKTDELIQKTIRTKFKNCTVVTIAHRLNTVIDSDRILVMDAGKNVEFDHPYILLKKESGYLRNLVNETGPIMSETLTRVAESAYNSDSFSTHF